MLRFLFCCIATVNLTLALTTATISATHIKLAFLISSDSLPQQVLVDRNRPISHKNYGQPLSSLGLKECHLQSYHNDHENVY